MFGLEEQKKKKKVEDFVFDLEKELKNGKKRQTKQEYIEKRIQELKNILRTGEEKDQFDSLGLLLHGYTSALKVIARFGLKEKG